MDRHHFALSSGRVLTMLHSEGSVYGYLERLADGSVREWEQVWVDEYRATGRVFPGPVSALRHVMVDRGLR